MFSFLRHLLILLCLSVGLFVLLLVLAIDDKPSLETRAQMSPSQIALVKRFFDRNDPRRLRVGAIATAELGRKELDLALNYAINQLVNGVAELKLEAGKALIGLTLPLPNNPLGGYLNLQIEFVQTDLIPDISGMKVGALPVPGFIAESLLGTCLRLIPQTSEIQQLARMIKHIRFQSDSLLVRYQWRPDLPGQISNALLSSQEREQLLVYQKRLTELSKSGAGVIGLTDLIRPLFELASVRSKTGDPTLENRAVIRVLAFYVNQKDLSTLVQGVEHWPRPKWRPVTLQNRDDFSKHFLISAFLAADAGTPLANAMGVYKEIQDSQGGSGFSFNDIAADRAGTRFGERAISEKSAKALQTLLLTVTEVDIMPKTADLPEFMSAATFQQRFGGLEGAAYRKMMQEIELRISALAISRI